MTSLGQLLRETREARGISLEEIASATKIVPRYLEALEADRLDLMPGGFFVKGIIRAYARSVGLDPEEILGRYRNAGLLAAPEHGQAFVPGAAATPPPPPLPHAEPAPAPAPVPLPAAALDVPKGPSEAEAERAGPSLLFEEAPKPRLSPETRKAILSWGLGGLAALVVLGTALVLWSPWRHRPAPVLTEAARSQAEVSPSQKIEPPPPASAQAQQTAQAPGAGVQTTTPPVTGAAAAPKVEPAPAAEEPWKGLTIEIVFEAETWIQVYTDGELQIDGLFPAGATARATAAERLLIHTGNAGGFTFKLNGRPAKPLGRRGQVLTDVKITVENFKDFLEVPPSGPPTG